MKRVHSEEPQNFDVAAGRPCGKLPLVVMARGILAVCKGTIN